jgi:hypothetical protein
MAHVTAMAEIRKRRVGMSFNFVSLLVDRIGSV